LTSHRSNGERHEPEEWTRAPLRPGPRVAIFCPQVAIVWPIPARSVAYRARCQNNLEQIGLALHNYQLTMGHFPADETYPTPASGTVSVFVALLPYIEQDTLTNQYLTNQGTAIQRQISIFDCASDPSVNVIVDGGPSPATFTYRYLVSYAFNYGTWFLYDWAQHQGGDGAFAINHPTKPGDFTDGMSNTLAAAEVKTGIGYIRSLKIPNTADPTNATLSATPADLLSLISATAAPQMSTFASTGGTLNSNPHLDYNNPTGAQSGLTTALPPNMATKITVAHQNAGTGTPVTRGGNQAPIAE
jgi:hypothetical protein